MYWIVTLRTPIPFRLFVCRRGMSRNAHQSWPRRTTLANHRSISVESTLRLFGSESHILRSKSKELQGRSFSLFFLCSHFFSFKTIQFLIDTTSQTCFKGLVIDRNLRGTFSRFKTRQKLTTKAPGETVTGRLIDPQP